MARTFSSAALASMLAQSTGVAYLTLLNLSHSEFPSGSFYFVNNPVAITSNGQVYAPFPFQITLPDDSEDAGPRAQLQIDNISREIVQYVRSVNGAERIGVSFSVVMSSELDVLLADYPGFELRNISFDVHTLTGDVSLASFLDEPFPSDKFTPNLFPGLF
mgnify:FL=1